MESVLEPLIEKNRFVNGLTFLNVCVDVDSLLEHNQHRLNQTLRRCMERCLQLDRDVILPPMTAKPDEVDVVLSTSSSMVANVEDRFKRSLREELGEGLCGVVCHHVPLDRSSEDGPPTVAWLVGRVENAVRTTREIRHNAESRQGPHHR